MNQGRTIARRSMYRGFYQVYLCILILSVLHPSLLALADSSKESRDALRHSTDQSWYNYESDELVFPDSSTLDEPSEKLARRHDFIVKKVDPEPDSTTADFEFLSDWSDALGELFSNTWFLRFLYLLACIALGVLVYFLLRQMEIDRFNFDRKSKKRSGDNIKRDQARVIDLPFAIEDLKTDLWSEVLRFRDQHDFSKSIVYLYGHMLVELDAAQRIRLRRGKTNRIYLKELRDNSVLRKLHEHLIERFESVFFGRHEIEEEQFELVLQTAYEMKAILNENHPKSDEQPLGKHLVGKQAINSEVAEDLTLAKEASPVNVTSIQRLMWIAVLSGAYCTTGCGANDVSDDQLYGEVSLSGAKRSIASLSVFRSMCEKNGLTSAHLNGLSSRNKQLDVIVFAPKTIRTPNASEIEWFEAWLREQPERYLIFIGRDFSPAVRYWSKAIESASKLDRVTFANQKAIVETAHEELRWREPSSSPCDWFKLVLRPTNTSNSSRIDGPWKNTVQSDELDAPLRGYFEPHINPLGTENSEEADPDLENVDENRFASTYTVERLIESTDGRPILFSMESPQWASGKVFVFANGSILLNEGLTFSGHRKVANQLISSLPKNGKIGFLSPSFETIIRSDTERQEASGFELLRVWPLSLISMQALFLGFIVLLALFPIFGRPQKPLQKSNADFGLHIEALGKLLQRTQDKSFALHKIASYFRDVKKEPNSPWSQIAPPSKEFSNDRVVPPADRK